LPILIATLLAAEEKNPILPSASELIWGSIAFLIVFALLAKFAFPPAAEALRARTEKIRGDIDQAERDRDAASQLMEDYRAQLASAHAESNRIIEDAKRRGEEIRRELQARAETESNRILARAQDEIAAERDRAIADVRSEVGNLAVDLAGRMIGDSLDRDRQLGLVDRYIEELAGASGDGDGAGGGTGR
jgi:F-type H+-transporting ATPase subunit b